jgi:hypothetical protein
MINFKKIKQIFEDNNFNKFNYSKHEFNIDLDEDIHLSIYIDRLDFWTMNKVGDEICKEFYIEKENDYKIIDKINYFLKIFCNITFDFSKEYFTITEKDLLNNKEFLNELKFLSMLLNIMMIKKL